MKKEKNIKDYSEISKVIYNTIENNDNIPTILGNELLNKHYQKEMYEKYRDEYVQNLSTEELVDYLNMYELIAQDNEEKNAKTI